MYRHTLQVHFILLTWFASVAYGYYGSDPGYGDQVRHEFVYLDANKEPICQRSGLPVCATDGYAFLFFENECRYNAYNYGQLFADRSGLIKTDIRNCFSNCDAIRCYEIYEPVCAKNMESNFHISFANVCELTREICTTGYQWQHISEGLCWKPKKCSNLCTAEYNPVCGVYNGIQRSFSSECELRVHICETGHDWKMLHKTSCELPTPTCESIRLYTSNYTMPSLMVENTTISAAVALKLAPMSTTTPRNVPLFRDFIPALGQESTTKRPKFATEPQTTTMIGNDSVKISTKSTNNQTITIARSSDTAEISTTKDMNSKDEVISTTEATTESSTVTDVFGGRFEALSETSRREISTTKDMNSKDEVISTTEATTESSTVTDVFGGRFEALSETSRRQISTTKDMNSKDEVISTTEATTESSTVTDVFGGRFEALSETSRREISTTKDMHSKDEVISTTEATTESSTLTDVFGGRFETLSETSTNSFEFTPDISRPTIASATVQETLIETESNENKSTTSITGRETDASSTEETIHQETVLIRRNRLLNVDMSSTTENIPTLSFEKNTELSSATKSISILEDASSNLFSTSTTEIPAAKESLSISESTNSITSLKPSSPNQQLHNSSTQISVLRQEVELHTTTATPLMTTTIAIVPCSPQTTTPRPCDKQAAPQTQVEGPYYSLPVHHKVPYYQPFPYSHESYKVPFTYPGSPYGLFQFAGYPLGYSHAYIPHIYKKPQTSQYDYILQRLAHLEANYAKSNPI